MSSLIDLNMLSYKCLLEAEAINEAMFRSGGVHLIRRYDVIDSSNYELIYLR